MNEYIKKMESDKRELEHAISDTVNAYCGKYPIVSNITIDFDSGKNVVGDRFQRATTHISLEL